MCMFDSLVWFYKSLTINTEIWRVLLSQQVLFDCDKDRMDWGAIYKEVVMCGKYIYDTWHVSELDAALTPNPAAGGSHIINLTGPIVWLPRHVIGSCLWHSLLQPENGARLIFSPKRSLKQLFLLAPAMTAAAGSEEVLLTMNGKETLPSTMPDLVWT